MATARSRRWRLCNRKRGISTNQAAARRENLLDEQRQSRPQPRRTDVAAYQVKALNQRKHQRCKCVCRRYALRTFTKCGACEFSCGVSLRLVVVAVLVWRPSVVAQTVWKTIEYPVPPTDSSKDECMCVVEGFVSERVHTLVRNEDH